MRLQLKWTDGVGWLNDAYNSNPDSLAAAFETLSALPCAGRRFVVIGEMLELGPSAEAAHLEAGRAAAAAGFDGLWAVGRWGGQTVRGAREGGLAQVLVCADPREAAEALESVLQPRDLVLLKGSRGVRLETIEELWRQRREEQMASPTA
jgi:UDP-N-acetylmuramoyl-tripeptide--D-alanyl-D-alanine ligase